jgi:hypothetical protein
VESFEDNDKEFMGEGDNSRFSPNRSRTRVYGILFRDINNPTPNYGQSVETFETIYDDYGGDGKTRFVLSQEPLQASNFTEMGSPDNFVSLKETGEPCELGNKTAR